MTSIYCPGIKLRREVGGIFSTTRMISGARSSSETIRLGIVLTWRPASRSSGSTSSTTSLTALRQHVRINPCTMSASLRLSASDRNAIVSPDSAGALQIPHRPVRQLYSSATPAALAASRIDTVGSAANERPVFSVTVGMCVTPNLSSAGTAFDGNETPSGAACLSRASRTVASKDDASSGSTIWLPDFPFCSRHIWQRCARLRKEAATDRAASDTRSPT